MMIIYQQRDDHGFVYSFVRICLMSNSVSHLHFTLQDEEAKYAKVIKIGDKLFGVPAVQSGTFGTDVQQQEGRRWEELVYELNGEVSNGGDTSEIVVAVLLEAYPRM